MIRLTTPSACCRVILGIGERIAALGVLRKLKNCLLSAATSLSSSSVRPGAAAGGDLPRRPCLCAAGARALVLLDCYQAMQQHAARQAKMCRKSIVMAMRVLCRPMRAASPALMPSAPELFVRPLSCSHFSCTHFANDWRLFQRPHWLRLHAGARAGAA